MPNAIDFTFSDLIAGYVISYDEHSRTIELNTSDGRPYRITLTATTTAEMVRNLGDGYLDATAQLGKMLQHGRLVHVYGIFYPQPEHTAFEAKHVLMFGKEPDEFRFEAPGWWVDQIARIADFYLDEEFGPGATAFDYRAYRTDLSMEGAKTGLARQETDTVSRLVYGLATAHLMTGRERYLRAAVAGANYMIDNLCSIDRGQQIAYWYHALVINPDGTERKIFASESGDDYDAIPCYEQIYALAGITQVYRITGDPRLREIIDLTVNLFQHYFKDPERGGYYSHIDPVTFDPHSPSLDDGTRTNAGRKNWNSIGDHIPAYLINLYLATGERRYADELAQLCDIITEHFPDYDSSPFVQEKFHGDWSHDRDYGQQLDRAIVGHNLKIAWNLTRVNNLRPNAGWVAFARRIADVMPAVGMDRQRGGWYDMVERHTAPGESVHRLVWHDRKAWWQQEQGILAYQILDAVFAHPFYNKYARESSAFYNGWMLDTTAGGVYFNVLANGNPFMLGGERSKGSHSMAMYHSAELCYLSAVYQNLETEGQPLELYFAPRPGAFGGTLRVAPDLLPPRTVRIAQVWVDGHEHADFDADAMTVNLPHSTEPQSVRVRLTGRTVAFSADTLRIGDGTAKISLAGSLTPPRMAVLRSALEGALEHGCRRLELDAAELVYLDPEATRYLAMLKQQREVELHVAGAAGQVEQELRDSRLDQELVR
ncbi:AGE family epimerase/isomerase [Dactylosporangium sp. CA-139114]|uniref:AGE family epimerase/isomerase n=1 Tax=Dactylosporangium sp. CA-139114 TaxID=3239931 RepID=UPI003D961FBC